MFFLGNYETVIMIITVFILLLIMLSLNIDEKKSFISTKTLWIIETVILVSFIVISYFSYQSQKVKLKKHFLENGIIVCRYKKENIVIKKDANYILKDEYFIKGNIAIDIDKCKSLEE